MKKLWIIGTALLALLAAEDFDKATFRKLSRAGEKKLKNHYGDASQSREEKFSRGMSEKAFKGLLKSEKKLFGYSVDYAIQKPQAQAVSDLLSFLDQLPSSFQNAFDERVIGVYFIEGFLGGGMTEVAFDKRAQKLNYFIILNADVLSLSVDDLMEKRYNSMFSNASCTSRIDHELGERYGAKEFIFLHELAHVVDFNLRISPMDKTMRTIHHFVGERPFPQLENGLENIWNKDGSLKDSFDDPIRDKMSFYGTYYGEPSLSSCESSEVFDYIKGSPFSTLYGSSLIAEDVAENLSLLVWTRVLDQPYRLVLIDEKGERNIREAVFEEKVARRLDRLEDRILD